MKNTSIAMGVALLLIAGCTGKLKEENNQLTAKLDSLHQELEARNYSIGLLEQIGYYMDSIDSNRKWIKVNLETGLAEEDYVERMKVLNQYVQKAEWTIGELEKTRSAYASQVKRLKKSVGEKDEEIRTLQLSVAQYRSKNEEITNLLTISQEDYLEVQENLDLVKGELSETESKVFTLMENIKLTKAESFYAQGENMEEIARRTQLAPRRKKKALEEALTNYKSAQDLGYEKAVVKVEELKKKLKKD